MKISDIDLIRALTDNKVRDQTELSRILEQQGYSITQASLSRRLKKLRIQKVNGVYLALRQTQQRFDDVVLSIKPVQPNLILVRTRPGYANSFAFYLDEQIELLGSEQDATHFNGMAGTIAGDDTILVIVERPECLLDIAESIGIAANLTSNRA